MGKKITDLDEVTALNGTDLLLVTSSQNSNKCKVSTLYTSVSAAISSVILNEVKSDESIKSAIDSGLKYNTLTGRVDTLENTVTANNSALTANIQNIALSVSNISTYIGKSTLSIEEISSMQEELSTAYCSTSSTVEEINDRMPSKLELSSISVETFMNAGLCNLIKLAEISVTNGTEISSYTISALSGNPYAISSLETLSSNGKLKCQFIDKSTAEYSYPYNVFGASSLSIVYFDVRPILSLWIDDGGTTATLKKHVDYEVDYYGNSNIIFPPDNSITSENLAYLHFDATGNCTTILSCEVAGIDKYEGELMLTKQLTFNYNKGLNNFNDSNVAVSFTLV